jgi:hypothetical protein
MSSFEIVFFNEKRPVYHRKGTEGTPSNVVPVDICDSKKPTGVAYYVWKSSSTVPIDGIIFATLSDLTRYCKKENYRLGSSHFYGTMSFE